MESLGWICGKAKDDEGKDKVHLLAESYAGGRGGKTSCGLVIDPYFWTRVRLGMEPFVVLEKCAGCFENREE